MNEGRGFQSSWLACIAIVAGGSLMTVLWLVFTHVHGPTSFNQERAVLGRSMHFWGSMLGGPPNLLVSLGLIILSPRFASRPSRLTRFGYTLTLIGLLVPAGIDLYIGALSAPFFVPVVGIGLILLALGCRSNPQLNRQSLYLLMLIGIFQVTAFALALLPLEVSDSIGGYRIYGIFAHLLSGAGWVAFGMSILPVASDNRY